MLLNKLAEYESTGKSIKVGLVGAGAMGLGIAHQLRITPGMELSWVADIDEEKCAEAARVAGGVLTGNSVAELVVESPVDVFVEATNTIKEALRYCEAALESGAHVVLMNAEVDLAFGVYLKVLADKKGLVVTSDAGDQHGVLSKMLEEISLWGFQIIQAGNIKGFLKRDATVESLIHEAQKRNLNPIQCCAYTDGSKLNIEMALLGNAYGYLPTEVGMTGPRLDSVTEVLENFDFSKVGEEGSLDYILGAEPGGGVYVVGKCEEEFQHPYLTYYKLEEKPPYYLFYRPYHLCHLETPHAIAKAYFYNEAYLQPWAGYVTDVYSFAKRDLKAGETLHHTLGSDEVYGMVASVAEAEEKGWIPQCLLDSGAVIQEDIAEGTPLLLSQVTFLDQEYLHTFYNQHGKDTP